MVLCGIIAHAQDMGSGRGKKKNFSSRKKDSLLLGLNQ
jgi:hypothetical protein